VAGFHTNGCGLVSEPAQDKEKVKKPLLSFPGLQFFKGKGQKTIT